MDVAPCACSHSRSHPHPHAPMHKLTCTQPCTHIPTHACSASVAARAWCLSLSSSQLIRPTVTDASRSGIWGSAWAGHHLPQGPQPGGRAHSTPGQGEAGRLEDSFSGPVQASMQTFINLVTVQSARHTHTRTCMRSDRGSQDTQGIVPPSQLQPADLANRHRRLPVRDPGQRMGRQQWPSLTSVASARRPCAPPPRTGGGRQA